MILRIFCFALLSLCLSTTARAEALPEPKGQVLLTVSGSIEKINAEQIAIFDRDMLLDLPVTQFETTTIWTDGLQSFSGVSLHHLKEKIGMDGETIIASAINDYSVEIPLSDAKEGGPIIAYLRNGTEMSVRSKGPLWIVYPYDTVPEYRSETIYSRSIWQLDRLEVIK